MMRLSLFRTLAVLLAAYAMVAGEAHAQGFFERLFGLRPAQPVYPPANVPQPSAPAAPTQGPPPPGGTPEDPAAAGAPGQPAGPAPARPVVLKPPTEDSILGRELKLNGSAGSLQIDRAGRDLRAQVTLAGRKLSQETQLCTVKLANGEALTLTSVGRPEGLPRYELQAPTCPITFDVLEGAVLVTAPTEACVIQDADCSVEPRGLWGPDPNSLLPRAQEFEQARGAADKAVRENYKVLTQRAGPQAIRSVVAEQAAFSSERETLCRSYQREGAHGFCNARFTEGRAVALAARLGLIGPTAEAQAVAPDRRPRPPRQASQPLGPSGEPGSSPTDIR